jgi:hypothetical protein
MWFSRPSYREFHDNNYKWKEVSDSNSRRRNDNTQQGTPVRQEERPVRGRNKRTRKTS